MEEYSKFIGDLITINKDRVEGYTQAIALLEDHDDEDLRQVLVQYRSQTQNFLTQLDAFLGDDTQENKSPLSENGQLVDLWKSKATQISGANRKSILESCEQREDAYRIVYEAAIDQLDEVPLSLANTIRQQAELQYMTHNHIKTLRDAT